MYVRERRYTDFSGRPQCVQRYPSMRSGMTPRGSLMLTMTRSMPIRLGTIPDTSHRDDDGSGLGVHVGVVVRVVTGGAPMEVGVSDIGGFGNIIRLPFRRTKSKRSVRTKSRMEPAICATRRRPVLAARRIASGVSPAKRAASLALRSAFACCIQPKGWAGATALAVSRWRVRARIITGSRGVPGARVLRSRGVKRGVCGPRRSRRLVDVLRAPAFSPLRG